MEGKCWNCEKMNEEKKGGYFWCNCRDINNGGGGLWYLPLEVCILRRELDKIKQDKPTQRFLDDEERE